MEDKKSLDIGSAKSQELQDESILKELKEAYNSVMMLTKSPTHRKIALDIEKKMRKAQKTQRE